MWFKKREGDVICAEVSDIKEGFRIYDKIRVTQELNLPPYIYEIYKNVICEAQKEKQQLANGEDEGKSEAQYDCFRGRVTSQKSESQLANGEDEGKSEAQYDCFRGRVTSQKSERCVGLTIREICIKYYQTYKRYISENQIRREILPALELAGLIQIEQDPMNRRRFLIYPLDIS